MNILIDKSIVDNLIIKLLELIVFSNSYDALDDTPEEIHRLFVNQ